MKSEELMIIVMLVCLVIFSVFYLFSFTTSMAVVDTGGAVFSVDGKVLKLGEHESVKMGEHRIDLININGDKVQIIVDGDISDWLSKGQEDVVAGMDVRLGDVIS